MHRVSDSAVFGAAVSQRLCVSECKGLARVRIDREPIGKSEARYVGAAVSQRLCVSECKGLARVRAGCEMVASRLDISECKGPGTGR